MKMFSSYKVNKNKASVMENGVKSWVQSLLGWERDKYAIFYQIVSKEKFFIQKNTREFVIDEVREK